jgi:leader peptidase (prepilin peptidase)/N-methyltransferase
VPSIILASAAVGAVVGILMMVVMKHRKEVPIPFGPYLAGAGLLALYFRQPLGSLFSLG